MQVNQSNLVENLIDFQNQAQVQEQQSKVDEKKDRIKEAYFKETRKLEGKNIFQKLFFTWIGCFLKYGSQWSIDTDALPQLSDKMKPENEYHVLEEQLKRVQKSQREGLTLIKAIGKSYFKQFILLALLSLLITAFAMSAPVITHKIIDYIKVDPDLRQISEGVLLLCAIAFTTLGRAISQSHLYYEFAVLGFNLANTLSLLIYSKSLKYPLLCEKKYSISEIINYSQVDSQRMTNMGYQLTAILFTPIQIVVGIWLMYSYIGVSFLSGIATMIIVIALTFYLTKKITKINQNTLKAKDQRMKVTEEILDIIKFIKINAIQKYFFRRLNDKRDIELNSNRKRGFLQVFIVFLYFLSCPLIISFTFITYILLGNEITPTVAFTTIMIFNILQSPLRQFPSAISSLIQMYTSIKRIQKFLLDQEIQYGQVQQINAPDNAIAIRFQRAQYQWGVEENNGSQKVQSAHLKEFKRKKSMLINQEEEAEEEFQKSISDFSDSPRKNRENSPQKNGQNLSNSLTSIEEKKGKYMKAIKRLNTTIAAGKFTIVIGDIGSGKSSLLMAILNEMKPSSTAYVTINGSIAYSAQKPWIMSSTVRDNILFTLPYQKKKFQEIIHYASLKKDLQLLVKGQFTEIGQKGVNLSGGQKARIALARALYSENDIYLLDDIISAVDVHVGEYLIKQTILGYLKHKTVVMTTHAVKFSQWADQIIVLKKGVIVRKGHFKDISETPEFQEVFMTALEREGKQQAQNKEDKNISQDLEKIKQTTQIIKKVKKQQKISKGDLKKSFAQKAVQTLIVPEDHNKGQIELKVVKQYVKINGGKWFFGIVMFSMIAWVVFSTLSNIQMEKWCESQPKENFYLYIYLGLSILSSIFAFIRAYILVLSGFKQGQIVHKKIIKSLLYASLTEFYNRVPIGRIMNRLTKDLRELDETIGYALGQFLTNLFSLLGTLSICLYASTPYVLIPIVLIAFFCTKLRNYYMTTNREVIRVQAITNSPIVSGFISTINGLSTIRAYKVQQQFLEMQIRKIETNKRARITKEALGSWFSVRLTILSFTVNLFAIGFCLLGSTTDPSLAGLLLAYALNLSDDIISLTFSWANLETRMISVERIFNFMKIQPQKPYQQYCKEWRTKQEGYKQIIKTGSIQFKEVSVKYRSDLPYALRKLSFKIQPGMKIGIVGRTGAGKSTIISTLLRITNAIGGEILIDNVNLTEFHVKDLRNSITMIDQEPTLINSTFRENLDLAHRYTDQELYQILKQCNLYQTIMEKQGLEGTVSNQSLSAGEKQLLCICRAFLKKSKIVLIDEATANIDLKNDEIIQKVIQTKFINSTVLTIAHRLSTLKNCDKILVMGEGKALEWGSPLELEAKEGGIFSEMMKKNASQFLV